VSGTDLERLKVPRIVAGRRGTFDLLVLRSHVAPKSLVEALGLSWVQLRAALAKAYQMKTIFGIDWMHYKDVITWLAKLKPFTTADQGYTKLLQATIPQLLQERSVEIAAFEASEAVRVKDAGRSIILDLDAQPLDSVGHFRRDASLLPNRVEPDAINGAILGTALDIFVPENGRLRHIEVATDAYRANLLGDFRQAYKKLYTGPEALARAPDHPMLQRPLVPEQQQVVITPNGPVVRTIPAHAARFRWEIFNAAVAAKPKEHPTCPPKPLIQPPPPASSAPSAKTTKPQVSGGVSRTPARRQGFKLI